MSRKKKNKGGSRKEAKSRKDKNKKKEEKKVIISKLSPLTYRNGTPVLYIKVHPKYRDELSFLFSGETSKVSDILNRDLYLTLRKNIKTTNHEPFSYAGIKFLLFILQALQGHIANGHSAFKDKIKVLSNSEEYYELNEKILRALDLPSYKLKDESSLEDFFKEKASSELRGYNITLEKIVYHVENSLNIEDLYNTTLYFRQAIMDMTLLWIIKLRDKITENRRLRTKTIKLDYTILDKENLLDKKKRKELYKKYYGAEVKEEWFDETYEDFVERIGKIPLLGLDFIDKIKRFYERMGYKWYQGSKKRFMKGLLIGFLMDDPFWRRKAEEWYNQNFHPREKLHFGKGECLPFNIGKLKGELEEIIDSFIVNHPKYNSKRKALLREEVSRYLNYLSSEEFTHEDVEWMKKNGYIPRDTVRSSMSNVQHYIRLEKGSGVCDDTAILLTGMKYGLEAMLGVIVADWFDTISKLSLFYSQRDKDESIGYSLIDLFVGKNKLISEEEILQIIAFSASRLPLPDHDDLKVSEIESKIRGHSSERYFNMVQNNEDYKSNFERHTEFILDFYYYLEEINRDPLEFLGQIINGSPNNIIGFQGMSINKYYRELINRISVLRKYMKMKGISNKRRKIINYDSWSKILKYRDDLKEILSEKREISPIFILPEEKADNLYRKLSNMPNIPDLLSEDTSDCILDIKTLKKILT